ncbi:WD40 repeat-like protein [Imleria badia]|nr:WD40 repeat-like protein [Imleria badia]
MSSVIPQWYDNDVAWQQVISAHDKPITAVAYLPDGRRVATGSRDGFVKVWNVENGRQEGASMKHEGIVICLAVTRDGTKIMVSTSDEDAEVKVWDVESHELVETYSTTSPLFAISPNDRLLAVSDEDVDICTMMEGRQVNQSSVEVGKFTWSTPFSPKGKKLACGTDDDVRVYDVDSGKLILGPLEGHEEWVNCVLWSRDGSRLFSASNDGTIRCWNSDAGTQIGQPWTGHTGHIRSLSLSPDGYIIASASEDHTVRFWDGTSGRPIGQHLKHADIVTAVCFSPSGEFVASAGWDGKIYFWPAPSPQSVKDWVIMPFMYVLALVLTVS